MLAVASHVAWAESLQPGKKSICGPALWWDCGDLQVAQDEDEPDAQLDAARQLCRPARRGAPQISRGRGEWRLAELPLHRRPPPGAAWGWKPTSQRLPDESVREYVNLRGSVRTHVHEVVERDHKAPRELRLAAAVLDEWTCDLVSTAREDALRVGVGRHLRDFIGDTDKAEKDRDNWR